MMDVIMMSVMMIKLIETLLINKNDNDNDNDNNNN